MTVLLILFANFYKKNALCCSHTHVCVRDRNFVPLCVYGLGPDLYLNVEFFRFILDLLFLVFLTN